MSTVISNNSALQHSSFSGLIPSDSISTDDMVLLLACRRYMATTNTSPLDFCKELFELASQELDHFGDDFAAYFSKDDNEKH